MIKLAFNDYSRYKDTLSYPLTKSNFLQPALKGVKISGRGNEGGFGSQKGRAGKACRHMGWRDEGGFKVSVVRAIVVVVSVVRLFLKILVLVVEYYVRYRYLFTHTNMHCHKQTGKRPGATGDYKEGASLGLEV